MWAAMSILAVAPLVGRVPDHLRRDALEDLGELADREEDDVAPVQRVNQNMKLHEGEAKVCSQSIRMDSLRHMMQGP